MVVDIVTLHIPAFFKLALYLSQECVCLSRIWSKADDCAVISAVFTVHSAQFSFICIGPNHNKSHLKALKRYSSI